MTGLPRRWRRRYPARFVRRAETIRTQTWEGSTMSDSSLFEEGLKVRKEVLGEDYVNKSIAGADEFTRTMAEWSTEFCWGALWTRPGLDRRTRSIVNLAMLGALNRPHELKLHVKGALKNRLTKDEIKEILLQVAVYCGIPSGIDAFRNARGVQGSGRPMTRLLEPCSTLIVRERGHVGVRHRARGGPDASTSTPRARPWSAQVTGPGVN